MFEYGYEWKVEEYSDKASIVYEKWISQPLKKYKLKWTLRPAPERCAAGEDKYGCFIQIEPEMNEVAEDMLEVEGVVPFGARAAGFSKEMITIFGQKPSKRKKAKAKMSVKVRGASNFVPNIGRKLKIQWQTDMGIIKSIKLRTDGLRPYEQLVNPPVKIGFKPKGDVSAKPGKTKISRLRTWKPVPITTEISWQCKLCPIQVRPRKLRIKKGSKVARYDTNF